MPWYWPFNQREVKQSEKAMTVQSFFGGLGGVDAGPAGMNTDQRKLLTYFRDTTYSVCKMQADRITSTTLRLYNKRAKANKCHRLQAKHLMDKTCAKHFATNADDIGEVLSHDAITLLNRPNPFMTGREYRRYCEIYNLVSGVNYTKVESVDLMPIQLWLLPPYLVKIKPKEKYVGPLYYQYGDERIAPEDMLEDVSDNLMDPYSGTPGQSPIKATMASLYLQDYVSEKLLAIMSAPKISGILTPKGEDQNLMPDQVERLRRKAEQFRHGRQGDWMIADAQMNFIPVTQTPTDLSAVELLRYIEELICRAVGIPYMLYSGNEGNSKASYLSALQHWLDGTISSRLRDIEDFLNFKYLPKFDGSEDLFFAFDAPIPHNLADQIDLQVQACGGPILTPNESRMQLGYSPVTGGDELRSGPHESADDTDAADDGPPPKGDDEDEDAAKSLPSILEIQKIIEAVSQGVSPRDSALGLLQAFGMNLEIAKAVLGSAGRQKELKGEIQRRKSLPPSGKALEPFKDVLRKHFNMWKGYTVEAIEKIASGVETKDHSVKGLPHSFKPTENMAKDLAKDSEQILEGFFLERGEQLLNRVDADEATFKVFNVHVKNYAETASLNFAESTLSTTTKSVNDALDETRNAIAEGLEAGVGMDELSEKIGEIFEDLSEERCDLIALTESSRAWNEGLRQSAKDSGVVVGFKWLTTSDPCDECEGMDDEFIELDGELPPAHPNCQCAATEVLDIENEDE
jgi:HK97 family phage portal protein